MSFSILLIVLFSSSSALSQRIWNGASVSIAGPIQYLIEECADTTINDTVWTELTQRYFYSDTLWVEQSYLINEKNGLITVFNDQIRPRKILLYDFSLDLNDTFFYLEPFVYAPFEVIQVDSVNVLGVQRKRMKLRHVIELFEDVWVEGIGSIKHNFFSPCEAPNMPDIGSSVSCFKSSPNSDVYHFIDSQLCFINEIELICSEYSSAEIINAAEETVIFPNPTTGELIVKHDKTITTYSIHSSDGSLLVQDQADKREIDLTYVVERLAPGIYFLRLSSDVQINSIQFVKL